MAGPPSAAYWATLPGRARRRVSVPVRSARPGRRSTGRGDRPRGRRPGEERWHLSRARFARRPASSAIEAVTACADHLAPIRRASRGGRLRRSKLTTSRQFTADFVDAVARQPLQSAVDAGLVAECRLRPATVDRGAARGAQSHRPVRPGSTATPLRDRAARRSRGAHRRRAPSPPEALRASIDCWRVSPSMAPKMRRPLGSTVDMLYRVKPNIWQGVRRVEMEVAAWRPSEA